MVHGVMKQRQVNLSGTQFLYNFNSDKTGKSTYTSNGSLKTSTLTTLLHTLEPRCA